MKTEEIIQNYLKLQLNNDYAVAGIMGNMFAESGLKSNIVENCYKIKYNITDEDYTNEVDSGIYQDFIYDKIGYGLVQQTFQSLKRDLLNYAKSTNRSIGDLNMQLEFLCKELQTDFKKSVWDKLLVAKTPDEASNIILLNFERPANMGPEVQQKRADFSRKYYKLFHREMIVNARGENVTYCGSGVATAQALTAVNVRDKDITGKVIGTVNKNQKVEVLEVLSNQQYKIVWPGDIKNGYGYTSNKNNNYYKIL